MVSVTADSGSEEHGSFEVGSRLVQFNTRRPAIYSDRPDRLGRPPVRLGEKI
jgi:hypothetical protein